MPPRCRSQREASCSLTCDAAGFCAGACFSVHGRATPGPGWRERRRISEDLVVREASSCPGLLADLLYSSPPQSSCQPPNTSLDAPREQSLLWVVKVASSHHGRRRGDIRPCQRHEERNPECVIFLLSFHTLTSQSGGFAPTSQPPNKRNA